MKINGHEYSNGEVLEALQAKGYSFDWFQYGFKEDAFMGGYKVSSEMRLCALKDGEVPSEKNLLENVAIREFQKEFVKPPLI